MKHLWTRSTLGHGEVMCARCCMTNREAILVFGLECPGPFNKYESWNMDQEIIGYPFIPYRLKIV